MPDIGLFELLLVGLLLFVVVGPERMPEFFGQIGTVMRTLRRWANETRTLFEQQVTEVRAPIQQTGEQFKELVDSPKSSSKTTSSEPVNTPGEAER